MFDWCFSDVVCPATIEGVILKKFEVNSRKSNLQIFGC